MGWKQAEETHGDTPDVALAAWCTLVRHLAPLGIRVGPEVLALLRDMRLAGNGVFTADGLLRAKTVEGLAAMVEELRAHTAGPGGMSR